MTGETHATVGIASSLALSVLTGHFSPETVVIGGVLGTVGALFPDLDLKQSKGSKMLDKVFLGSVPVVGVIAFCLYTKRLSLQSLKVNEVQLIALAVWLALAFYARTQSHRTMTHSIACLLFTSVCMECVAGGWYAIHYLVGFTSHLALDFLNTKGEQLLWPLPGRWCLKLCPADGVGDKVFRYLGLATALGLLVYGGVGYCA